MSAEEKAPKDWSNDPKFKGLIIKENPYENSELWKSKKVTESEFKNILSNYTKFYFQLEKL